VNQPIKKIFLFSLTAFAVLSCRKEPVIESYNGPAGEQAAGSCTVYDQTSYAFSYKVNGLTSDEAAQFFVGNSFFNQNWVEAPSTTTARDGLGPLFNAKSCAGCHFRDGRGLPMKNEGLLFRMGTPSSSLAGSVLDAIYAGQLQDHGISNIDSEGDMDISYTEIQGTYPDGTPYSLRVPSYSVSGQNYGSVTGSVRFSPRIANQMVGLGLLELIPESSIIARADANDKNNDGISGRANFVADVLSGGYSLGRFGWKANVPNIPQQVAGAFNGDIGITSSIFPNDNHTASQTACNGLPTGGSPEIGDDNLNAVILYSRVLAVPAQRNNRTADFIAGQALFKSLNCVGCHTPRHTTGSNGSISALKNIVIYPFTDLLLHDMGPGLADGLPDYKATGSEWRTPPLWGLGLIQTVNNHTYLLHDGRARNFEEAILWHGGEAEKSKSLFMLLPKTQREQLLFFLGSL